MMLLPLLCSTLLSAAPKVETRFEQVAPVPPNANPTRSPNQQRAVILLHGFIYHQREETVAVPAFRPWQTPDCTLVKALKPEADVYAFAYGQNACLDDIVKQSGLTNAVAQLKKLGYKEIILLGHSAGGLVARHFVEDNPDCGVTKVIQVCTPNGGTLAAKMKVHASQQAFVDCLTPEVRLKTLEARGARKVPDKVEFVCVLGFLELLTDTDGIVPCVCQWSEDLRKQCIPVVPLGVNHHLSTRSEKAAELLAKLVREKQPRWEAGQVEQMCKQLFKK